MYSNIQSQNSDLQETNSGLNEKISGLQQTNGALRSQNEDLSTELRQTKEKLSRKEREILLVVDQKKSTETDLQTIAQLREHLGATQKENKQLQERLRSANQSGQLAAMEDALRKEQTAKAALERSNQQLQTLSAAKDRQLNEKEAALASLRAPKPIDFEALQKTEKFHAMLDQLLGNNKELDEWRKASMDLEALKQKLASRNSTTSDVPALMKCLEEQSKQALSLQSQLKTAHETLQTQKAEFERMLSEKNQEVRGIRSKLEEVTVQKAALEHQITNKGRENEELRAQLRAEVQQKETISRESVSLREQLAQAQKTQSGDNEKLSAENQRMSASLESIKQRIAKLAAQVQELVAKNAPEGSLAVDLASTFDSSKPLMSNWNL